MEITIYSNCRLSKSYNEVIQHNYLDAYLNTLTKTTMNLNNVYVSSSGRLPIELQPLGINYLEGNYMKIVDNVNEITRYFFIDSLEIINGVAIVYYSEDIWSNYAHKIHIAKGNVSNLRYGIGNSPKYLPNDYISNDKFQLNSLFLNQQNRLFNVVIELSFYKAVQEGVPNERYNYVVAISSSNNIYDFSLASAINALEEINQLSSIADVLDIDLLHTGSPDSFSFEIINAYIIPKEYMTLFNYRWRGYDGIYIENLYTFAILANDKYNYNFTINNNYKRYAIGTLDNFIITEENGSNVKCELICTNDNIRFRILLQVSTNIIDISPSFNYEFAVSAQSADVTQQQAIARQLKNNMLDIDRENIVGKAVTSSLSSIGEIVGGSFSNTLTGRTKGIISGISTGADTIRETITGLEKNDLRRWYVNYSAYKTNSSVNTKRNIYLNAIYGIIDFTIIPDNENYVNSLIETTGYNVLMIVNDNSLIESKQESQDYNIVKFSSIWLYGNVTHDIQLILESILEKGIKIWFKSTI